MVTGFRFASAGLYLSAKHQWTPVARGAGAQHVEFPPLLIEDPTPIPQMRTTKQTPWRAGSGKPARSVSSNNEPGSVHRPGRT